MSHAAAGTRVQEHIGDPVSDKPPVPQAKLEQIFKDLQSDLRDDHELNG
jgi:heterodisulfide reductase subunit C